MELTTIQSKIYELRGRRVMLDFDLAVLYGVETKRLKEQMKRNIERFPEDFMFELSPQDLELVAICDQFPDRMKHSSVMPLAFTEQGVSMLASVLRSPIAVQTSISIMRAFVAMRNYLMSTAAVTAELAEIRTKLQLLERNDELLRRDNEDTLETVNDLSEDVGEHLDTIYQAIGELSVKVADKAAQPPRRKIGYIQNDD